MPDFKNKNILILTALEIEKNAILKIAQERQTVLVDETLDLKYTILNIDKAQVILSETGVGNVNAALAIYSINKKIPIDYIVMLGVAGALDQKLSIGDIVVGERIIQHDAIISLENEKQQMRPGSLFLSLAKNERPLPEMICDKELHDFFVDGIKSEKQKVYNGEILSGSEFVGSIARKIDLKTSFPDSLIVEMEAAGVAQIALKLKIPFVIIKTVADRVRPAGGAISDEYITFKESSAENAAKAVNAIIKTLQ